MNQARARQAEFNSSSRDQWDAFGPHREKVSRLLGVGGRPGPSRLCVLGVGNGLDLDLAGLLGAHREVHLVDLDAEALGRGVASQDLAGHRRLRLFGGLDVTAMLEVVASWSPRTVVGAADLASLAEAPARLVPPALAGPYDVIASTCLLRPLIGSLYHAVGGRHPEFSGLVRAIRAGHLRLLARGLAAGGRAVLVTDLVSSETLPELGTLPESALTGLLHRLDREGNHFHGVGPSELAAAVRTDRVLRDLAVEAETAPPWRWELHGRVYLVWAITLRVPSATSR